MSQLSAASACCHSSSFAVLRARNVIPKVPNSAALLDCSAPAYTSVRETISKSTNPAAVTASPISPSRRAPTIQPVHSAMSSFASCGTGFCTSMSPSCRRPLGFEDSSHVAQGGVFVRHQVQHAVRDDHVSPEVLDRQGFAETFTEIDVVRACRRGARARFLQHGGCHVDADHITRCANHFAATRLSMPPPQPTSTTCSACCKVPTLKGLPVPANEAIVGSGIPSSQAS